MSFRHERYIGLDTLLKKWKNMSFRYTGFYGNYTLAPFDETICFTKFLVRLFSIL